MCEPTTIMAIGAGLSTISAYGQSKAAKSQAQYQAAVQRNNTIIAERKAEDSIERGERQARLQKLKGKQLASKQMVSLAAQGVDITDGTSIDLLADTAEASAFEEEIIKNNAERQAYNHQVSANNFESQAGLFDAHADAQNPLFNAATTAAVGIGNIYASNWYQNGRTT
jgi:hypothetical protein